MLIPLDDAFLFQKQEKYNTNGRNMATRTNVCLYEQPVTWIFNPFIENYYLIIVVFFSSPRFSIYDIFIQKKTHEVSTQGPLTLNDVLKVVVKTSLD